MPASVGNQHHLIKEHMRLVTARCNKAYSILRSTVQNIFRGYGSCTSMDYAAYMLDEIAGCALMQDECLLIPRKQVLHNYR